MRLAFHLRAAKSIVRVAQLLMAPGWRQRALVCVVAVLGLVSFCSAQDPSQPSNGYLRTHVTLEAGIKGGVIDEIAQSQDGFLWLRSDGSWLTRFDGRHFNWFDSPRRVRTMAVAPNGDLWVGTADDLERIPAAALNQFGRLPATSYHPSSAGPGAANQINCLRFSRSGDLWVGTADGLFRFHDGQFRPMLPGIEVLRMNEAPGGRLLAITVQGFVEWDGSRAVPHPELAEQLGVKSQDVFDAMEDSHGVTWFSTAWGVARRVGGSIEKLAPYGPNGHGAFRTYEDPQGNVWIVKKDGLFRATAQGLEPAVPDVNVRSIYGDSEGNLWVGMNGDGLFRIKDRAARMFTTADGLPNKVIMTVLASSDGGIWTGANCGGLSRFDGRRFETYDEKSGLLNSCVWSLAEDSSHDLWIATYGGGVFRFHGGRFTQYSKAQGFLSDVVTSLLVTRDGSLWCATTDAVTRLKDGRIRNYTKADGLSSNRPLKFYEDRNGVLWVGTNKGLDRMVGDRFVNVPSVPAENIFPLGEDRSSGLYLMQPPAEVVRFENNQSTRIVSGISATEMAETGQGELWLSGGGGIFRFPPGGLDRVHAADEPLDYVSLDSADGFTALGASIGRPNAALSRDGRLWIATSQGLAMLDLPRLPRTAQKPTIYIEEIAVGRNVQRPSQQLLLPPDTHHVEFSFDAIEVSAPEKIRLQYRMDGVDKEWLDAQPPGHATYSNIPHGTHAFHVRATNREGIWDRNGMVYWVTQQPYFYETFWFQFAAATMGILLVVGFYRWRLAEATSRLKARLEERLAERERIGRELHDTLLQGFQGLILHFEAILKRTPPHEPTREMMKKALDRADEVLLEGRNRVRDLRSETVAGQELPELMAACGKDLAQNQGIEFTIAVEGTAQPLDPIVRDEIYQIGREAVVNAFRHSQASKIEVEIAFSHADIRLRVRDNGIGTDQETLDRGRPGHWGLSGMRERAQKVGAQLSLWSRSGAGTEIELSVPAKIAFVPK
jgi:signal transduction histidine kinase/ligand-binding sensor domain-containing protein